MTPITFRRRSLGNQPEENPDRKVYGSNICLSFPPGPVLNWLIPFWDFKVLSGDQHAGTSQETAIIAGALVGMAGTLVPPALLSFPAEGER